jgi:hypothetical protein
VRRRFFFSFLLTLLLPSLNARARQEPEPPTTKVIVQRVVFSKPTLLSQDEIAAITSKLRDMDLQFSTVTWPEDFTDYAAAFVQKVYQDRGYFLAKVSCEAIRIDNNSRDPRVNLFVDVQEGARYRLREIRWKNVTAFPESQLLALMPIKPGETFKRVKIAEGLDAAARLYGSQGYINFTYIPNTIIDEAAHSIALEIDVAEGGIFHWGDLHVEGMSEADRRELLLGWEGLRGQLYANNSLQVLDKFFAVYFRPLRPGVVLSDYVTWKVNGRDRLVEVYLSLVPNASWLKYIPKSWRRPQTTVKSNP